MNACCLCSAAVSDRALHAWNRPLFRSASFVALPSLGSLVEGWLLLVPKHHFISMGALPVHLADEMQNLRDLVSSQLTSRYGELCAFEHGPSRPARSVGCGVDHAHLHLVPLNFDLALAAGPFLPADVSWSDADRGDCRAAFERGRDYLYLEQPLGRGRIAVHDQFGSQVFRKAIAARLGMPEQFSWREYPQAETVARTIHKFNASPESAPAPPNGSEDGA